MADGGKDHSLYIMKTTIDHTGRLVIPKYSSHIGDKTRDAVRGSVGKRCNYDYPRPLAVKSEPKGRLLIAVPTEDTPRLSANTVERTRKTLRNECSGASN
jgi:hypothetical protein